ncbi:SpoVG family [Stigmatella aurantiaca DW4/3-1]|uniref:Putative septation protein SpoVG n=2 Tax=Stigmatella aurantiaca (strain DW4/3-1) TaxID=378806 RepID=Q08SG2_STIAD|nr:SpoVG family [Stigmatella aurantiaca DW4/3-1]
MVENFFSPFDGRGGQLELRVAHHLRLIVAVIDLRLEDLDTLLAVYGTLDAADQFFRLSGEHGAADNLYPPDIFGELVHELIPCPQGRRARGYSVRGSMESTFPVFQPLGPQRAHGARAWLPACPSGVDALLARLLKEPPPKFTREATGGGDNRAGIDPVSGGAGNLLHLTRFGGAAVAEPDGRALHAHLPPAGRGRGTQPPDARRLRALAAGLHELQAHHRERGPDTAVRAPSHARQPPGHPRRGPHLRHHQRLSPGILDAPRPALAAVLTGFQRPLREQLAFSGRSVRVFPPAPIFRVLVGGSMNITDVRVFPVTEDKLKAYVTITLDHCFVIRDLKVIHGASGLFIAMPAKKRKDGTYKDIAHPLNADTRTEMERVILSEYERQTQQGHLGASALLAAEAD